MGRWLAPHLAGPQHWVLHDRDPDLLRVAANDPPRSADGSAVTVETRRGDLTRLGPDDLAGATLITASALLDMLTAAELERFARSCVGGRVPALVTLSVTGRVRLTPRTPSMPRSAPPSTAPAAHRGGRTLLGPVAARAAVDAFGELGAGSRCGRARGSWMRFPRAVPRLAGRLGGRRRRAAPRARRRGPRPTSPDATTRSSTAGWPSRVQHLDLLALPPRSAPVSRLAVLPDQAMGPPPAARCRRRRRVDVTMGLAGLVALLALLAVTVGLGRSAWIVALGCAAPWPPWSSSAWRRRPARARARRPGHAVPGLMACAVATLTVELLLGHPVTAAPARPDRACPRPGCRRRTGGPAHRHGHGVRGRFDGEVDAFLILVLSVAAGPRSAGGCSRGAGALRLRGRGVVLPWMRVPLQFRLLAQGGDRLVGIPLTVAVAEVLPHRVDRRPRRRRPGSARRVVRPRRLVAVVPPERALADRPPAGALAAGRSPGCATLLAGAGVVRAGRALPVPTGWLPAPSSGSRSRPSSWPPSLLVRPPLPALTSRWVCPRRPLTSQGPRPGRSRCSTGRSTSSPTAATWAPASTSSVHPSGRSAPSRPRSRRSPRSSAWRAGPAAVRRLSGWRSRRPGRTTYRFVAVARGVWVVSALTGLQLLPGAPVAAASAPSCRLRPGRDRDGTAIEQAFQPRDGADSDNAAPRPRTCSGPARQGRRPRLRRELRAVAVRTRVAPASTPCSTTGPAGCAAAGFAAASASSPRRLRWQQLARPRHAAVRADWSNNQRATTG